MTVNSHGLYAVISPGNRRSNWAYAIFREGYSQDNFGQDKIHATTGVRPYGSGISRASAERKARRRISKMQKAYDMLTRPKVTLC